MSTEIATREHNGHGSTELTSNIASVTSAIEQLKSLRTFVKNEMVAGTDFGVIPGTGTKPTILLPGAQKVAFYFNCYPTFENKKQELGNGHVEIYTTCRLKHRGSAATASEGCGSCSSMESKYRYRNAKPKCPKCKAETIFRDKKGDGFYCYQKVGGCGANFGGRDSAITGQAVGKTENPDIYDLRNTILKMSMKRAQVSAALNLGAMSELFTQDLEDTYGLPQGPPAAAEADHEDDGHRTARPAPEARRETPAQSPRAQSPAQAPFMTAQDEMTAQAAFRKWLNRSVAEANDEWQMMQMNDGVPIDARTEFTTHFKALNGLMTSSINRGFINAAFIMQDDDATKRDKDRTREGGEWLLAEQPEQLELAWNDYLDQKYARIKTAGKDAAGAN